MRDFWQASPAMDPTGTQFEELTARPGAGTYVFALAYVFVGVVSIGLALDDGFAAGKVAFAADAWRAVLGGFGVLLAFLGARGFVRTLTGHRRQLTPELHRRAATRGKILLVVGAGLLAIAVIPAFRDETIDFSSWTKPLYIATGILFIVQGLAMQWNPTRFIRQQRIARGEGRPGTVRIVRASDTGTSVNDMPQTRIEFELEVGGQTHLVSDKIVMERAKLALLIPGSTMNVLVDRVDPNVFHIDWDSWKPPAGAGDAR